MIFLRNVKCGEPPSHGAEVYSQLEGASVTFATPVGGTGHSLRARRERRARGGGVESDTGTAPFGHRRRGPAQTDPLVPPAQWPFAPSLLTRETLRTED